MEVKTKSKLIPVSEIYGSVCQGEGPLTGRPTIFLRLGGCDYRCSWCDSLYAVEPKYVKDWVRQSEHQIVDRLTALVPGVAEGYKHVTISGGNPAIHDLTDLTALLRLNGWQIGIETQGSVHQPWLKHIDHLILSPKPPSSGNITPYDHHSPLSQIVGEALDEMDDGGFGPQVVALKVVVFHREDFEYAKAVHKTYPTIPCWVQVGTAVGKDTAKQLIQKYAYLQKKVLEDPAMFDVHVGLQTHVLVYGHKRGI